MSSHPYSPMEDLQVREPPKSASVSIFRLAFSHGRVDNAVLSHEYRGRGTNLEPFVVDWIPGDSGNPLEWPKWLKWTSTMISAITCFVVAFSSSAYTGTMREIIMAFQISDTLATAGVSLYVLGFALGPLLWAPLSEIYGRQIVFFVSYGLYALFSAICIVENGIVTLLVMRFFAGAFGSSTLTNAGGVIGDLFEADDRSIAMGVFSLAPAMGPTLGPFIGGYLGQGQGWKWVMGLMAILAAAGWVLGSLFVPETYAPLLLRRRAGVLSKKTGKVLRSALDIQRDSPSASGVLATSMIRPWLFLIYEPIVAALSIYTAIVYGTLYLLFGAYPVVFQLERGWSPGKGGLAFLGIAVGMIAAIPVIAVINKAYISKAADVKGRGLSPEDLLPTGMIGAISIPIGMFWFAWTSYRSIHWASPVAAGVPFGLGMTLVFHSVFSYLIDAYGAYSASALAANTVLRSLFGAAFPLFTRQMYEDLGTQWASSVPAFLVLLCTPAPFLLYRYGAQVRARSKYGTVFISGDDV